MTTWLCTLRNRRGEEIKYMFDSSNNASEMKRHLRREMDSNYFRRDFVLKGYRKVGGIA